TLRPSSRIPTLSLHDALPSCGTGVGGVGVGRTGVAGGSGGVPSARSDGSSRGAAGSTRGAASGLDAGSGCSGHVVSSPSGTARRSEEHTSELQSLAYLVCRLL